MEIAKDISRFIVDYMAKFKSDVEDIFSEFKVELAQALKYNEVPGNPILEGMMQM